MKSREYGKSKLAASSRKGDVSCLLGPGDKLNHDETNILQTKSPDSSDFTHNSSFGDKYIMHYNRDEQGNFDLTALADIKEDILAGEPSDAETLSSESEFLTEANSQEDELTEDVEFGIECDQATADCNSSGSGECDRFVCLKQLGSNDTSSDLTKLAMNHTLLEEQEHLDSETRSNLSCQPIANKTFVVPNDLQSRPIMITKRIVPVLLESYVSTGETESTVLKTDNCGQDLSNFIEITSSSETDAEIKSFSTMLTGSDASPQNESSSIHGERCTTPISEKSVTSTSSSASGSKTPTSCMTPKAKIGKFWGYNTDMLMTYLLSPDCTVIPELPVPEINGSIVKSSTETPKVKVRSPGTPSSASLKQALDRMRLSVSTGTSITSHKDSISGTTVKSIVTSRKRLEMKSDAPCNEGDINHNSEIPSSSENLISSSNTLVETLSSAESLRVSNLITRPNSVEFSNVQDSDTDICSIIDSASDADDCGTESGALADSEGEADSMSCRETSAEDSECEDTLQNTNCSVLSCLVQDLSKSSVSCDVNLKKTSYQKQHSEQEWSSLAKPSTDGLSRKLGTASPSFLFAKMKLQSSSHNENKQVDPKFLHRTQPEIEFRGNAATSVYKLCDRNALNQTSSDIIKSQSRTIFHQRLPFPGKVHEQNTLLSERVSRLSAFTSTPTKRGKVKPLNISCISVIDEPDFSKAEQGQASYSTAANVSTLSPNKFFKTRNPINRKSGSNQFLDESNQNSISSDQFDSSSSGEESYSIETKTCRHRRTYDCSNHSNATKRSKPNVNSVKTENESQFRAALTEKMTIKEDGEKDHNELFVSFHHSPPPRRTLNRLPSDRDVYSLSSSEGDYPYDFSECLVVKRTPERRLSSNKISWYSKHHLIVEDRKSRSESPSSNLQKTQKVHCAKTRLQFEAGNPRSQSLSPKRLRSPDYDFSSETDDLNVPKRIKMGSTKSYVDVHQALNNDVSSLTKKEYMSASMLINISTPTCKNQQCTKSFCFKCMK